jgi:hypothetical protein
MCLVCSYLLPTGSVLLYVSGTAVLRLKLRALAGAAVPCVCLVCSYLLLSHVLYFCMCLVLQYYDSSSGLWLALLYLYVSGMELAALVSLLALLFIWGEKNQEEKK